MRYGRQARLQLPYAAAVTRARRLFLFFLVAGFLVAGAVRATERPEEALAAGKAALEDGLFDLARKELDRCLELTESGPADSTVGHDAALALLRVLQESKRPQEVLDLLQNRKSRVRLLLGEPEMVFWKALALHETGKADEALALLEAYERKHAGTPYVGQAIRLRGWCHLRLNNYGGAIESFKLFDSAALGTPAEEDQNLLELGRVLMQANRREEAVAVLKRLASKPAQRREVHEGQYWLGRVLLEDGKWEAAVQMLAPLVDNSEADQGLRADASLLAGRAYETAKAFGNAVNVLKRGLGLAQEASSKREIGFALGRMMLETDQLAQGVATLKALIAENPRDRLADSSQLALAFALMRAGKQPEAAAEFQYYIETYTNAVSLAQAHQGKGQMLGRLGRHAEAAASLVKAYRTFTDPVDRVTALFRAADEYFANRQYGVAGDTYRQVIREFPDSAYRMKADYQVGECMAQDGMLDAAKEHFRTLVNGYPRDPVAEDALLRLAGLNESAGQLDKALEVYDEMMRHYEGGSQVAEALHGRGMALYRLSRYGEALRDFEKLMKDHPSSRRIESSAYRLSMCYFWMGLEGEAIGRWEEFLAKYPESEWAPDVVFWTAKTEFNQQHFDLAEDKFVEFANRFPSRPEASGALLWAGTCAMERKEYLRAIELLTRMVKEYPNSPQMDRARFAQGDAMSALARFADAIVVYNEIIVKYPNSPLVLEAWGRKGDCQFTLGGDDPQRYRESMDSYRVVENGAGATLDLVIQAEYKIGKCLEKTGQVKEAFEQYYRNGVIRYLDEIRKGANRTEAADVWFVRSGLAAAELMEAEGNWRVAVTVLQRVVEAGVRGAQEASARIARIRAAHPESFSRVGK